MQETIDVLTAKNSQLLAEREVGDWIRGSGDAEANNDLTAMVQKYITEIEELRAKLCESEKLAEQIRKESAKAKRLSQTFSPAGKVGSAWNPPGVGGVVDLNMEDDSGYSVQVCGVSVVSVKKSSTKITQRPVFKNLSCNFIREVLKSLGSQEKGISFQFFIAD